jgi:hypothetical protein
VDPSDPKCQIKKQVRFGDTFQLIPYNSTTGDEILNGFDYISPDSKLQDSLFTFTQTTPVASSPHPSQTPSFGPMHTSLPPLPPLLSQASLGSLSLSNTPQINTNIDDKIVKYGLENVTLNIIKSPTKNKNSIPVPTQIEYVKDRCASLTGGVFSCCHEKLPTIRGESHLIKQVSFSIRPADDPLLTVQVFSSSVEKNNKNQEHISPNAAFSCEKSAITTTISPQTPTGPLISSVPIHSFYQHYPVFTGDVSDQILKIILRDVGTVTIPLSTLSTPPANLPYKKFAPPTTRQEYYDYIDEPKQSECDSILRIIQVHGSQLSVNLPIRYTRIIAEPTKAPFVKGQNVNPTFNKLPLPQPNSFVVFFAFFMLAYRIFISYEKNLSTLPMFDIMRLLGPLIIIAFLSVSYLHLFTGNKGHSLDFKSNDKHCHYIMQFLLPQDSHSPRDVMMAFPVPSPFVLANKNVPFGSATATVPDSIAATKTFSTQPLTPTASQNSRQFDDIKQLLSANCAYQYQLSLHKLRTNITENSLDLFQILDTIRTSTLFTDANLNACPYTLPQSSMTGLDDKLNKEMVKYNNENNCLKNVIKNLHSDNKKPENIANIRAYSDNISFSLSSAHYSKSRADVKLYYPFVFKAIRESHSVTTEDFLQAWTFSIANLPSANTGAGRSGALFMRSSCQRFIFKTMSPADMATLHAVVKDYGEYITTHSSMLMRIFGVFRIIRDGKKQYFLIANNAFYLPDTISKHYTLSSRYDLKGRTPKRDPENRLTEANDGVWKDLQLNRVFPLDPSLRDQITSNLDSDVKWLQAHDCIDYSLLVGVAENKALLAYGDDLNPGNETEMEAIVKDCAIPSFPADLQGHRSIGIPPHVKAQDDNAEVFFVAIVDFLARFNNAMKKGAHAFKSLRWTDDELSTVNSQFYGDRFNRYVKVVFPPNGAVLLRTTEDLKNYFLQEARQQLMDNANGLNKTSVVMAGVVPTIIAPPAAPNSPTRLGKPVVQIDEQKAQIIANLSFESLPASLRETCRSPGSLIVTASGSHIIMVPQGVSSSPLPLIERSKLTRLTSQQGSSRLMSTLGQ